MSAVPRMGLLASELREGYVMVDGRAIAEIRPAGLSLVVVTLDDGERLVFLHGERVELLGTDF